MNPAITAASEEPERPVVDASFMQALNDISYSLKRLEEHLVPNEKKKKVPSAIFSKISEILLNARLVDAEAEGVACIVQR